MHTPESACSCWGMKPCAATRRSRGGNSLDERSPSVSILMYPVDANNAFQYMVLLSELRKVYAQQDPLDVLDVLDCRRRCVAC